MSNNLISTLRISHKKSVVKITEEAGYAHSTFYVHKEQEDLPFETLERYGDVLDHDFSAEIPEMKDYMIEKGRKSPSTRTLSYEELLKEKDYWKDKYYSLLEDHNKLIKEKYSND